MMQVDLRARVLESAGHQVAVAFNPRHVLRHLERGCADLLVLDLRFLNAGGEPDCQEGLALIRAIRERGCGVPLLVLSGWPDELYGQPEEKMVSRILVKPVASRELLATIEALVTA